jgi:hypothetical protein
MTPELFYGNYMRNHEGRLVRLGGFRDCVSVFGSRTSFDVNGIEPALLTALGAAPEAVRQIAGMRRSVPILDIRQLSALEPLLGPAAKRLVVGGNTIYTFRSTARLRRPDGSFSDLRRTVAAQVKFRKPGLTPRYHVLRWHDNITSEVSQWQ